MTICVGVSSTTWRPTTTGREAPRSRTTSPSTSTGCRPSGASRRGWSSTSSTTPPAGCRRVSSATAATGRSTGPAPRTVDQTFAKHAPGWTTTGPGATSRSPDSPRSSRPSGGTCSCSRRRPPGPTGTASRRRASPAPGTRTLLLGHGDLRPAVPVVHGTNRRPERAALPLQHARTPPRSRARELNQRGALFPWRTINGEESQRLLRRWYRAVPIDADIAHALMQYVRRLGGPRLPEARCDRHPRSRTAPCGRTWLLALETATRSSTSTASTGRTVHDGRRRQPVHQRHGPGEPVVRRQRLPRARCRRPGGVRPHGRRTGLDESEVVEWEHAAESMEIPFDPHRGIHPQDAQFLDKELWTSRTPPHPSVPCSALPPAGDLPFPGAQAGGRRARAVPAGARVHRGRETCRDFDYYDALTTGDSTLSAVVQSIMAAEVGYHDLAAQYFQTARCTSTSPTCTATPRTACTSPRRVASVGALVNGFGGMRDQRRTDVVQPAAAEGLGPPDLRLTVHGSRIRVDLEEERMTFTVETGDGFTAWVHNQQWRSRPAEPTVVPLPHHGPRMSGHAPDDQRHPGTLRADGSVITASIPTISLDRAFRGGREHRQTRDAASIALDIFYVESGRVLIRTSSCRALGKDHRADRRCLLGATALAVTLTAAASRARLCNERNSPSCERNPSITGPWSRSPEIPGSSTLLITVNGEFDRGTARSTRSGTSRTTTTTSTTTSRSNSTSGTATRGP